MPSFRARRSRQRKLDLYALEVSVRQYSKVLLRLLYDAVSVQTICLSWTTRVVNWSQETVMIASFFSFSLVIILIVLALL